MFVLKKVEVSFFYSFLPVLPILVSPCPFPLFPSPLLFYILLNF